MTIFLKKIKKLIRGSLRLPLIFISLPVLTYCEKKAEILSVLPKDITCLFFVQADNNLKVYAEQFVEDLKNVDVNSEMVNVIILYDNNRGAKLYSLIKNKLIEIKNYGVTNTTEPSFIKDLFYFIREKYPSKEIGVSFWSHGSAWLPGNKDNITRSFGYDHGREIDIIQMQKAIPFKVNFMIFDACYMGSIEVCAELRNKTDFILGSPIIVPSSGILNKYNIQVLLNTKIPILKRLSNICNEYYDRNKSFNEISVSVLNTSAILKFGELNLPYETIHINDKYAYPKVRNKKIFYDIEILKEFIPQNNIENISLAIKDLIVYNISCSNDSGVSIFIPTKETQIYTNYYRLLKWNKQTKWLDRFYF